MYEHQIYVGYQKNRYIISQIDYSEISGKVFNDTSIKDGSGLWELRYKDSVPSISNMAIPTIPNTYSIKELKNQLKCRYIDVLMVKKCLNRMPGFTLIF
jgi:hypothetical protein